MNQSIDPKSEVLREQGCLNSRPERVKNELFQQSEFFDPRDIVQVKYEMLRQVLFKREPISRVCSQFGFSRAAVYKILVPTFRCRPI